ncbi:GNAT family N-acetyltransferase [Alkalihalobacillus sp. 1P02AB]|uniref:GNAT family N-acetyltransferase n=1 Tax=Alkalihalobacillus sp. 1P02AB TaxID=3132260 RepID=UPI0039A625BA
MEIIKVQKEHPLFKQAVEAFWNIWGEEKNYPFYFDCMENASNAKDDIPSFYIALDTDKIIGTFAVIRNDLNSRQDLFPWLACLYVDEAYRGKRLGYTMLEHAVKVATELGHEALYLTSDLVGYYEKDGWEEIGLAYGVSGGSIKVYRKWTSLK